MEDIVASLGRTQDRLEVNDVHINESDLISMRSHPVIKHHHVMTSTHQMIHDVRTDEPRTTGDN